eukprot:12880457-Prorocentrum_lima.AAC.1
MLQGIHHLASISEELKNFEYTAVQVSVSEGMIPHRDGHDVGPRWTISTGTFKGGLPWTEHEKGSTPPPLEAKGLEPSVKGRLFATNSKWHKFDGTKWRGVTLGTGHRLSFVYFKRIG